MSFQFLEFPAARSFAFILQGTFSLSNTDAFQISVSNKTAKSWSYLQIEQILFMYGLLEGKRSGDIKELLLYVTYIFLIFLLIFSKRLLQIKSCLQPADYQNVFHDMQKGKVHDERSY